MNGCMERLDVISNVMMFQELLEVVAVGDHGLLRGHGWVGWGGLGGLPFYRPIL